MEYESNVKVIKVDTDDEYEFARDMQVIAFLVFSIHLYHILSRSPHTVSRSTCSEISFMKLVASHFEPLNKYVCLNFVARFNRKSIFCYTRLGVHLNDKSLHKVI